MNEKPLVSVIVPTHNRAAMLQRTINSVLAQTFENFELIVVSDGSKDNTDEVMSSFKDPRIRYLKHHSERGSAVTRNTGHRVSRGKYIAYLDDDDEWVPNKLELQLSIIQQSIPEVGLVYGWMECLNEGSIVEARRPTLRGHIFIEMLDRQAIAGTPTLLIKREVLDVVGGFDEELQRGDDGDFIRRITKCFEVDFVPEVLCKVYVGHTDRISVNSKGNLEGEIFAFEKRLRIFGADFERHPEQKANVLVQVGCTCLKVGQYKKGLTYFWKMLKSKASGKHKLRLLYQTVKPAIAMIFKKWIPFALRRPNYQALLFRNG
jgi:glycosyltransferase involved in cell wall biosynthesis